jgi:hypothetical protein
MCVREGASEWTAHSEVVWNSRRSSRQQTIPLERLFQASSSANHIVLERLASNARADFAAFLGADFEFHVVGVVDKHSVASRREVEGDRFVGLLRGCTAVYRGGDIKS